MYLNFFELNQKPFPINTDPGFLWMSKTHKEALAMLKYGVMDNRGFLMLTGDAGTGKTTLINALLEKLDSKVIVANIIDPNLKNLDFYNCLAHAFKLNMTFTTKGEFLIEFQIFLEKCFRKGRQVLLIIDEAQKVSTKMLEEIRLLSNIEHPDKKLINIFLVGQDELLTVLNRYENRALRQRITLSYNLKSLPMAELQKMIFYRLNKAGAKNNFFTGGAIKEIYKFSNGYPRLVNIICDHAMITAYTANKKTIDSAIIRQCAEDLSSNRPADMQSAADNAGTGVEPVPGNAKDENKYSGKYSSEERESDQQYPIKVNNIMYTIVFLLVLILICLTYLVIRALP